MYQLPPHHPYQACTFLEASVAVAPALAVMVIMANAGATDAVAPRTALATDVGDVLAADTCTVGLMLCGGSAFLDRQ